jgi:N-acetyl-gamma-glutamyl-phosphate reductase
LFTEVNESARAYNIGKHRHIPEIEQTLSHASDSDIKINFTPQLIPMSRGILSTIYVKINKGYNVEDIRCCLKDFYKKDLFINILNEDVLPSTRDVLGTNMCDIAIVEGSADNYIILVSVIDNLTKGSSGQAVQNMNVMYGFDEDEGLRYVPVFP